MKSKPFKSNYNSFLTDYEDLLDPCFFYLPSNTSPLGMHCPIAATTRENEGIASQIVVERGLKIVSFSIQMLL